MAFIPSEEYLKLTDAELDALPPKAKRDPETVKLYQSYPYLTAYALHTNQRVLTEGYKDAAGADASRDNWDTHGDLQRDFLISHGLLPEHRLLDIGCGGGRLARKVVPYLAAGNYHGVDISDAALAAAESLARAEGWIRQRPKFWLSYVDPAVLPFDFIWAHSVFTHLPPLMIEKVMREAASMLKSDGTFFWTYLPSTETVRYGLTQFRTTLEVYAGCAERVGLTFEDVPDWVRSAGHEPGRWSYGQLLAISRHRDL